MSSKMNFKQSIAAALSKTRKSPKKPKKAHRKQKNYKMTMLGG